MITLLAKWFVKKSDDVSATRKAYGMLCGIVGIFLNFILFIGKLLAGYISNSIAITADALNNLSDAGSSIVTLLGFKLASQKPDNKHPYGHGRMEYIAGFIVSAMILAMGFSLLVDSVKKIFAPQAIEYSTTIVWILAASILVKCYMAIYNFVIGKRVASVAIKAAGTDSISDVISTSVVLAATLISHFTGFGIDAYAGAVVGIFIIYAGISSVKDTLDPLLGQPPEEEFVNQIKDITLSFDSKIVGMHDLLVHDYGPGRRFISLHAEMPADANVLELHDIIDNLERKLQAETGCFATVHMDPIITSDPRVKELKEAVLKSLYSVDSHISIHDFRVVFGDSHTNLLFDVLLPFDVKPSDDEIKSAINDSIHRDLGPDYHCVVDVDRDYTNTVKPKHSC